MRPSHRSVLTCSALAALIPAMPSEFTAAAADLSAVELVSTNETGFAPIFNGRDLAGWDGDPRLWSVRDGIIRGETTQEKPAPHNTFLIWRGGKLRDFVLKLKFHIHSGNSGVQYR